MRKNKKDLNAYDSEMINISNKEQEILESYNENFIEYNEKVNYDDEEFDYKEEIIEEPKKELTEKVVIIEDEEEPKVKENKIKTVKKEVVEEVEETEETTIDEEETEEYVETTTKKKINYKLIINVCFSIIIAILIMIAIDVISVGRYNRGPYFAIPVAEYEDGGTKEYLGIGYKVIDYNEIQGRRGKQIGSWGIKYNTEPYEVKDLDLALEFTAAEETAYKKYYKHYLKIESKLESMDFETNTINFGYLDEDGKYTLKMTCNMASKVEELVNIDVEEKVYVLGTVTSYEFETAKQSGKLILSDCFASK